MENNINFRNTTINSVRIFPEYNIYPERQCNGKISSNSNESRIIKRRKLKGKIRTIMNITK